MFYLVRLDTQEPFSLSEADIVLGRDPSCGLCVANTDVSRRHAQIQFLDGAYWLCDMGSLNGTYLNGTPVSTTAQRLQPNDQIQLGSVALRFCAGDGEPFPTETLTGEDVVSSLSKTPMVPVQPQESPVEPAAGFPPEAVFGTGKRATSRPLEMNDSQLLDVAMEAGNDQSRILRTISQAEGRKFLTHRETPISGSAPWTLRAQGYLQLLYDLTLSLGHCTDLDQLSQELLGMIFRWIDADRGCILLFDPVTNRLEPKAKKVRDNIRQPRLIISRTILDYVLEHQEGVLTSDATQDSRWDNAASVVSVGIHEAICVPLQGRYGVVGAIYLDTFSHPDMVSQSLSSHRLNDEHLKLMITIAHHTAVAIEDTRYYSGMLQAERLAAVGQTVAMLSHHIKNILQGIQGGSYLIETGLKQHNETFISKGWQIVEKNQNRISTLVMDMLTFSKDRKPNKERGDLNATVADVVELMRSRAEGQNIRLVWQPAENLPEISFDAEGIHRAVLNLVTNAIDAVAEAIESDKAAMDESDASVLDEPQMPDGANVLETHSESVFADGGHIFDEPVEEHFDAAQEPSASGILQSAKAPVVKKSDFDGQVDVVTRWEPETLSVKILVKDTGLGLTKDQINYIFRPFESSKGNHGTGLGLPVSQKIVSEHGGSIRVEQRLPRGSRFIITLPME